MSSAAQQAQYSVTRVPIHVHNGIDSPVILTENINFDAPNVIHLGSGIANSNDSYNIYFDDDGSGFGDGDLVIEPNKDNDGQTIFVGKYNKPQDLILQGGDETLLVANDITTLNPTGTSTYLQMNPSNAGFHTTTTDTFILEMPNLANNPTAGSVGALTVVNGILKICTAVGPVVWTTVGSQ